MTSLLLQAPQYRLVYDAGQAGYTDWWFPLFGLGMLGIFTALLIRARRRHLPASRSWILYIGVPFLSLWVVVAFVGTYSSYAKLRDRLADGDYTVVEGVVHNFRPGDAGDHEEESWTVESRGRSYEYHYVRSRLSPGFRQAAAHGGPIREGLLVRLADVDGHIARLEVANER